MTFQEATSSDLSVEDKFRRLFIVKNVGTENEISTDSSGIYKENIQKPWNDYISSLLEDNKNLTTKQIYRGSNETDVKPGSILLVGPSGAGKSTLLKQLTGTKSIKISSGPRTTTKDMDVYLNYDMTFIDSPGLTRNEMSANKFIEGIVSKVKPTIILLCLKGRLTDLSERLCSMVSNLDNGMIFYNIDSTEKNYDLLYIREMVPGEIIIGDARFLDPDDFVLKISQAYKFVREKQELRSKTGGMVEALKELYRSLKL